MSKLTLAGIRRGNQFSPNHIGNDAAIFSLTVQHLRDLGCEVNEYIESDLIIRNFEETAIFNMVRNWTSSISFSKWKTRDTPLSTPVMGLKTVHARK